MAGDDNVKKTRAWPGVGALCASWCPPSVLLAVSGQLMGNPMPSQSTTLTICDLAWEPRLGSGCKKNGVGLWRRRLSLCPRENSSDPECPKMPAWTSWDWGRRGTEPSFSSITSQTVSAQRHFVHEQTDK